MYEQGVRKDNGLCNRDEYVITDNGMEVYDICVLLVHNVLQSSAPGASGDCVDCLL